MRGFACNKHEEIRGVLIERARRTCVPNVDGQADESSAQGSAYKRIGRRDIQVLADLSDLIFSYIM